MLYTSEFEKWLSDLDDDYFTRNNDNSQSDNNINASDVSACLSVTIKNTVFNLCGNLTPSKEYSALLNASLKSQLLQLFAN